jgi:uncharacterized protein
MEKSVVQPVKSKERIVVVDILRAWALLGVAIGNYVDYFGLGKEVKHAPDKISDILMLVNKYFFAAKSWTLLSVLFGYGFAILMNNVAKKGKNPILFFSKRMFWLFVLAFINSAFWFGDILKDYAILGLLLLVFYKASAKMAFRSSLVLLLILPFVAAYLASLNNYDFQKEMEKILPLFYSHNWIDIFVMNLKGTYFLEMINPQYAISVRIMMFACMLLGFAAQRVGFFDHLTAFKKQLITLFWVSLTAAVVLNIGTKIAVAQELALLKFFKPGYWTILCTMLSIMSGICWLYISGKLKAIFNGLQFMGKLTLTNYMVQNVIATLLFLNVGLGLFNTQPYWFYALMAVLVFASQILISKYWLSYFNYGPVEWVWRQLSYGYHLPLRKQKNK